jgi:hypothetical protein
MLLEEDLTRLRTEELISIIQSQRETIRTLEEKLVLQKRKRKPKKDAIWTEQKLEFFLNQKTIQPTTLTEVSIYSLMKNILAGRYYFRLDHSSDRSLYLTALDVLLYLDWEITEYCDGFFPIVRFTKLLDDSVSFRQLANLSYNALFNHRSLCDLKEKVGKIRISRFFQKVGKFGGVTQLLRFYEMQINNHYLNFMLIQWLLRTASFPYELEIFLFACVFQIEKWYEDRRSEKIKIGFETAKKSPYCQNYKLPVISREDQESEANYYHHQYVVEKKRPAVQSLCV